MVESFIQNPQDGTGKKVRTDELTIGANVVHTPFVKMDEPAAFRVIVDRIAPAQNKYIITIHNTNAARKLVIQSISLYNWNVTAVTGVILEFELKRITARTAGTAITPMANDLNDTLSSGIICEHGGGATDSTLVKRMFSTAEEVKLGGIMFESYRVSRVYSAEYEKLAGIKGLTLRQNQGITIKQITNSTIGNVSAIIVFTDEPA